MSFYKSSSQRAFGFLELLVVLVILSGLVTIGLSNFITLKQRGADAAASSDYRNYKTVVTSEEAFNPENLQFFIFNLTGPAQLPSPLNKALLSKNVQLHYAVKIYLSFGPSFTWNIHTFQFSHVHGRYYYRYVKVNETEDEYIIKK